MLSFFNMTGECKDDGHWLLKDCHVPGVRPISSFLK